MSEPILIQTLLDGSLDAKSLAEAANGDENTTVTTRLGETYPSAKKAIKQMFAAGGLPATPFTTKAKLDADATLLNDAYALVTDDADDTKNGYYQKRAGFWTYLTYNPASRTFVTDAATAAKNSAIEAAATDATAKANAAKSAALDYIESLEDIDLLAVYN